MINVIIDEFTPCLKDSKTGEIIQTEVIRIKRKSFLSKYNKKTCWFTNWAKLSDDNEIYALVIKGSVDIQGMVALKRDEDSKAVYISWMCAAPNNNSMLQSPKYLGIGGHLFAIAIQKSIDFGYNGYVYGFAANQKLVQHYVEKFNAEHIGILHPYHIAIDENNAKQIMEVYDYEWTDEEI